MRLYKEYIHQTEIIRKENDIRAMQDMQFAYRVEKLEEENQRLREEANKPKEPDDSPETRMLKTALGIANPTIQERVIDSIFPADSGGHWIPETIKTVFEPIKARSPILV